MSDLENLYEQKLQSFKECKQNAKVMKDFVTDINKIRNEIDAVDLELENLVQELKYYDIIDFLWPKRSKELKTLRSVNNLIKQLSICKNEVKDNQYINKADQLLSACMKQGYRFVFEMLEKSIDLFYLNGDFVVFTNLIESNTEIKQIILWNRSQECINKRKYYKGDLCIFYEMMIKQECFIWYKLFHNDFKNTVDSILTKKTFTLYEKFLFSVLLVFFEEEEYIEKKEMKKIDKIEVDDFGNSAYTQDIIYNKILAKCYDEYLSHNRRIFEI